MTKEELQAQISATEKGKQRTRYPRELMRAVVEHARPRVAVGESLSKVAGELGLKSGTLQRWCSLKGVSQQPVAAPRSKLSPLTFVRLDAVTPSVPRTGAPVEISYAGVSVRVPVGFDGPTLSRVLSVLKGAA